MTGLSSLFEVCQVLDGKKEECFFLYEMDGDKEMFYDHGIASITPIMRRLE